MDLFAEYNAGGLRLLHQRPVRNDTGALLNQPNEVSEVRPQFQKAMSLGTALLQLLVRFGYAELMPWSVRRPVEQVAIQI